MVSWRLKLYFCQSIPEGDRDYLVLFPDEYHSIHHTALAFVVVNDSGSSSKSDVGQRVALSSPS